MILLCGATGDLGGRTAVALRRAAAPVRALVRDGTGPGPLSGLGVEIVRGDFRRPDTLDAATVGVDTVVTTVTAIGRSLQGEKTLQVPEVDGRGTQALIDAAERAGVQRFVFVSIAGIVDSGRHPVAEAKRAAERRLQTSPMQAVIVRPGVFQEVWLSPAAGFDWPRRRVTIYGHGDKPITYVATDDVAEAIARLTLHDDPPRIVEFGGPEASTPNEAVRAFEQALGEPIRCRHVPRTVLRVGARLLAPIRPSVASLLGLALATDLAGLVPGAEPLTALGIRPRGVSTYIENLVQSSR